MVNPELTIWDNILELVKVLPTTGLKGALDKKELTRQTDLVADLGLVGDDAFEFMDQFSTKFNVKEGDYCSSLYFDAEGLWMLPLFKKKQKKMHITLGMLEMAALSGLWETEKLNAAYEKKLYQE